MKYIALIPAYKPDEKLLDLIDELSGNGFETVVVDDGSGLEYTGIFDRIDCTVLRHPVNYGKGHALRTGIGFIKDMYSSEHVIVTLDADGQHKVQDALRVAAAAERAANALILGSRGFSGKVPLRSRFGNACTRKVFDLASGVRVRDTQTGLRAFSVQLADRMLAVSGERYEYEMNVLMSMAKQNIPIVEITIETIYLDGNKSSHFSPLRDSARIYGTILKFCGSSLLSFGADFSLFALFSLFIPIQAANIGARSISAGLNYTLNHKAVFSSDKPMVQTASQYFLLAVFILAANTAMLTLLTSYFGMGTLAAKILTEIVMFSISFGVQRIFIFGEGR